MANTRPELIIAGHGNAVTSLMFSADGKSLVSSSYDQTVIVWDIDTGKMRRVLRASNYLNNVILTQNGETVFTENGQFWEAATGSLLRELPRSVTPLACSPDGSTLASAKYSLGSPSQMLVVSDIRTGKDRQQFPCGELNSEVASFSADGELVAIRNWEEAEPHYITTLYNLRTGQTRRVLAGKSVALFGVFIFPDTRLVAVSAGGDEIWDVETERLLHTYDSSGYSSSVFDDLLSTALSVGGRLLATGSRQGTVCLRELATSRTLFWQTQLCHGWVRALAFTADGEMLATGGEDHAVRLWDTASGELRHVLGIPTGAVEALAFAADGQSLTALGEPRTASLWSIAQAECLRHETNTSGLLTGSAPLNHNTARHVWNIEVALLPTSAEIPAPATYLALSDDGALLALYHPQQGILVWNLHNRSVHSTLSDSMGGRVEASFSPDNGFLAVYSDCQRIRLFDVNTGSVQHELMSKTDAALDGVGIFAFSPDGCTLAVGHFGITISLWDVRTGKRKRVMNAHRDGVSALAYSPDGKTLAIGTAYVETVWLKSLRRGGKETRLDGHTDDIRAVDFYPDGTRLASGSQDGTVRLWEIPSGKLLATFLSLPSQDWLLYTPEGYYTGSTGAEQYFCWCVGNDLLPAETFAHKYNNATEVRRLLMGGTAT